MGATSRFPTIAQLSTAVNTFFTLDKFFTLIYCFDMAELRVTNLDDSLMARVKAGAALAGLSIREFVAKLLTEALKHRAGRQRP